MQGNLEKITTNLLIVISLLFLKDVNFYRKISIHDGFTFHYVTF